MSRGNIRDYDSWTNEQVEALKDCVRIFVEHGDGNMDWEYIASCLQEARPGVTPNAVHQKAYKLGLYELTRSKVKDSTGERWTEGETELVAKMALLGKSRSAIRRAIRREFKIGRSLKAISAKLSQLRDAGAIPRVEPVAVPTPAPAPAPAPVLAAESFEVSGTSLPTKSKYLTLDKAALAGDLGTVFGWAESWIRSLAPDRFDEADDFLKQAREATSLALDEPIEAK